MLTRQNVFDQLKPLEPKMAQFETTGGASLAADEVETMQKVYPEIQALSNGSLSPKLDVGCESCIRSTFRVYISWYRRFEKDAAEKKNVDDMQSAPTLVDQVVPVLPPSKADKTPTPPVTKKAANPVVNPQPAVIPDGGITVTDPAPAPQIDTTLQPGAVPLNTAESVTDSQAAAAAAKGGKNA